MCKFIGSLRVKKDVNGDTLNHSPEKKNIYIYIYKHSGCFTITIEPFEIF